jgi:hypothetical protein
LGLLISSTGFFLLIRIGTTTSFYQIVLPLFLVGAGMGIFASPNRASIMTSVPIYRRGASAGFVMTGNAFSIGLVFLIMTNVIPLHVAEQLFSSSFGRSSEFSTVEVFKFLTSVRLIFRVLGVNKNYLNHVSNPTGKVTRHTYVRAYLTIFAAAATKTSKMRLGTAIVQTYPRHPLALAQQVLVLNDIAPGRLRLGIGPSHSSIIEGIFGLPQRKPLAHLREYVEVLRAILWEGKVNHHGEFFNIVVTPGGLVTSLNTARLPILVSALGEKAFQLAGAG